MSQLLALSGWLNARVMKLRVMVILGVWIAQVMEIACKVYHMDFASNRIGMWTMQMWKARVKKAQVKLHVQ